MKIQLDIQKDINKKLKIEKATKEYGTLQETIIKILEEHFNAK